MILAGARIPGTGLISSGHIPLLAVQGTADGVNPPASTDAFYRAVGRPKFLLELFGAGHEPPFTREQPQLGIVERATTAFLDAYLEGRPAARRLLSAAGHHPGVARLSAAP